MLALSGYETDILAAYIYRVTSRLLSPPMLRTPTSQRKRSHRTLVSLPLSICTTMKNFQVDKITVFEGTSTVEVPCCILFAGPESFASMRLLYPNPGERLCYMELLSWDFNKLLSARCKAFLEYDPPCEHYFGPVHFRQIYSDVLREGLDHWECSDDKKDTVRGGYLKWL